jgi:hypothetical protein
MFVFCVSLTREQSSTSDRTDACYLLLLPPPPPPPPPHSSRSQWPRGLRHEMSSPVRTLGSWVRIPLKAWISAFILFVMSCVRSGLATG